MSTICSGCLIDREYGQTVIGVSSRYEAPIRTDFDGILAETTRNAVSNFKLCGIPILF